MRGRLVAALFLLSLTALAATGCARGGVATAAGSATSVESAAAATTPATVPVPPRAEPPADPPVDLTVAVSGDLLIHSPVWQRAQANAHGDGYDFRPMFAAVRPYIAGADLALCHVETPLQPGRPTGYPVFRTPPALARAIKWAGWDACDTASNHSLDGGQRGIDDTGRALDRYAIAHTGSAHSAAAARRIVILKAKGVKIAYLAYTQISNGQLQPHWWSVNRASASRIEADARRARKAGADAVLVNLHWGDEYVHAPAAPQLALARSLTHSKDITGVVGQHVHVIQPIRRIGSRLVLFGEGNFLSNQTPSCCAPGAQDGLIGLLRLRVRDGHATLRRIDYVPTWVRHPDYTVVPAGAKGAQPAGELHASWRRTVDLVGRTRLYGPWSHPTP